MSSHSKNRHSPCLILAVVLLAMASLFVSGAASAADFNVTAATVDNAYTINSVTNDPPLTLVRGQTYTFDINACTCHPFQIVGPPNGAVVNNNVAVGTIVFTVPLTVANYTYRCSIHGFGGTITTIAPPPPPTSSTVAASSISGTGATLNGSINPNSQTTTASFIYGTDPALATGTVTTAGQAVGGGSTAQAISASISGLQPATTYYFLAQGSSSGGTAQGSILSFLTLSNNAALSNLVLGSGTLSPVFASGTTSYSASVANATTTITVTPTAAQANASITVNGIAVPSGNASSVPLNMGPNTVTIIVTAQDGTTTQTTTITVTRQTNLDAWRQTYFPGSTATTGSGADTATPQNDGIKNLIKFATGMNPALPGTMPGTLSKSGSNLTFTYTPATTAVADGVTFTVEYSNTLGAASWASDIVSQGTIGSGGAPVTATVPNGSPGPRFLHLKIVSP